MTRLLFVLLLVLVATTGCGTGGHDKPSDLTFRRMDGSVIDFRGDVLAWCAPWNDEIPTRALHVAALGGLSAAERSSYWRLWAVPEDIRSGQRIAFPVDFVWNRPRGAQIFAGDFEDTGDHGPTNEASTQQEESDGWITFDAVGCFRGDHIAFRVDAVLGSEFGDDEPIRAEGMFSGQVTGPPPGL